MIIREAIEKCLKADSEKVSRPQLPFYEIMSDMKVVTNWNGVILRVHGEDDSTKYIFKKQMFVIYNSRT